MSSPTRRVRVVTPRKRGWRRLFSLRLWLALFSLVVLMGAGVAAAAYTLVDIPDPNEAAQSQTSIIYYADGQTEMARVSAVDREAVELDVVPLHMQRAMLAAEDRNFYDNPGFSITGLGRAVWATLTGGPVQGGSTITQQYVKNYFLTQDQTLTRKARELVISLKVEQELSKDEILRDYLNTIYFGRGAYGIQAASRAYFGKTVDQLDVAESAVLSSVIRGPSLYDPAMGEDAQRNLEGRVDYVLAGMVEQGWLTEQERTAVQMPEIREPRQGEEKSGPNGYVVQLVKDELAYKVGLTPEQIDMGGLRITTTIEQDKQQAAIRAVENNLPAAGVRTGLVSLKPGDGAIMALYGGRNFREQPYSAATQAQLQGGSTFKVFTLVAALEEGISTRRSFDANSPRYFEAFRGTGNESGRVQNYNDQSLGWIDLRTATARSANTPYAELNIEIGPEKMVETAVKLGLPQDTLGLADNPANVFGTASPRVIDMAKAYATLAAGGVRAEPYLIKEAHGVDERFSTYIASPVTRRVIEEDVAADAVDAMRQVVLRGTAQRAQNINRPAAGKTGTTDENRAVWFDGFTPDIATAVGMYLPDEDGNAIPMRGAGLGRGVTGGSYPVDVWTAYMRVAVEGTEWQDFPERTGIGDRQWRPAPRPEPTPEPTREYTPEPEPTETETAEPEVTWEPTDVPLDPDPAPEDEGDTGGDPPPDPAGDQGDSNQQGAGAGGGGSGETPSPTGT
ncbi:MAG: transglycosylase domain-containing protein [Mobilicoccus sp.]|nr:transglycosylase domain-containing protein [Mobilicoccus sp.]